METLEGSYEPAHVEECDDHGWSYGPRSRERSGRNDLAILLTVVVIGLAIALAVTFRGTVLAFFSAIDQIVRWEGPL